MGHPNPNYLREKAAQFRELAAQHKSDISPGLLAIAAELDASADLLEREQRSKTRGKPDLWRYRLFLYDREKAILGRQDVEVADDHAAAAIAGVIRDACSDLCAEVELWQGARRIDWTRLPHGDAQTLSVCVQEAIIECEERLQQSQWAVGQSKRLLEQTARLVAAAGRRHSADSA